MAWQRRVVRRLLGVALGGWVPGGGRDRRSRPRAARRGGDTDPDADAGRGAGAAGGDGRADTDGAIAAATYFGQLYDYAFASGDAGAVCGMSAEA